MEITDVRIRLSGKKSNRVKAFATVTFDDAFVVRDMRIIEGRSGLFVAMPSRPLKDACPKCGYRNAVRSKYCSGCGGELSVDMSAEVDDKSLHRDVAHPITQEMRDYIHNKVIEAYKAELQNSGSAADVSEDTDKGPEEAETAEPEEMPEIKVKSSGETPPVAEGEENPEAEETKEAPDEEVPETGEAKEESVTEEEEQPEEKEEK